MRGEEHFDWLAGDISETLFTLGRVPVVADAVSRHALVALREMMRKFGSAPGTGYPALAVDDQRAEVDVISGHQRCQTENGCLRIATRIGDQLRGADFLPVEFRQAIH